MHSLESHLSSCPSCGEPIELLIDPSGGSQVYIEDCQVCCRPIVVQLVVGADGELTVQLRSEDE